jgi:TonB family protein
MKSCPRCGKQYPDSEGFCEVDGAALFDAPELPSGPSTSDMSDETPALDNLECPVCGGKALPGEVRCNYCGARLHAEGSVAAAPISTPAENYSGPQQFGDASVDSPQPDSSRESRRIFTVLGLSGAALAALAAGAWFALYLGNKNAPPQTLATPSTTAATAPIVELAKETPLHVQADLVGTTPRDSASLLKTFEDNKAGLANVYGDALNSEHSLSDGMVVRLHILPNGTVDNGAVRLSTSGNPSFDAEVIEAMTSWRFTSINGSGMTADYRVIFAPSASSATTVESDLNTKMASLSPNEPPEYAFSPGSTPAAALAEGSPSPIPSSAEASVGPSTIPGTAASVGTSAPPSGPTTTARLPPAPSTEAAPAEKMPAAPRVRRSRRAPREMAALPPPKPSLIARVDSELRANRRLRRVHAYTNGSVVTIFGKVFDNDDRLMAERTVNRIDGVSAVNNNLTTDTQQWQQNQALISQALQNAGLNGVQVKVIGGGAYLSGQVKTNFDRERAVTIAQAAAPVKVRENLITVAIGNILGF